MKFYLVSMKVKKSRLIVITVTALLVTCLLFIFIYKPDNIKASIVPNSTTWELVKLGSGDVSDMPTPTHLFVVNNTSKEGANLLGAFRLNQNVATASVQPLEGYAKLNHQTGTVNLGFGIIGNVEMNSPAEVSDIRSVQAGGVFKGSGCVENWTSFYATMGTHNGSGQINNAYGYYMNPWPKTGIRINNKWGIYISDSTAKNYFAGEINTNHLSGNSDTPTSTAFTDNSSVTISGNDLAGEIVFHIDQDTIRPGKIIDVTFSCKYPHAPKVILTCANENAPKLISNIYVTATQKKFSLNMIFNNQNSLAGTYKWNYMVVQ